MRPLLALALALLAAAPSRAADTILVVGDSHTAGAFGKALDGALRAAPGNRVATYGVCSAAPSSYVDETPHACGHWFSDFQGTAPAKWLGARQYKATIKGKEVTMIKTPEIGQLLADHAPGTVIVALGSNPTTGAGIDALLAAIHGPTPGAGARCVWIGPPDMRSPDKAAVEKTYQLLRKHRVFEGATTWEARQDSCLLIDSRTMTQYAASGGDGTHYNGALTAAGRKWGADAAAAALAWLP